MLDKNIEKHKQSIHEKTSQGRELVTALREHVPADMVQKQQRFQIFIEKMIQLQKNEERALA